MPFRRIVVTLAIGVLTAGAAAADPIEGNWRTKVGDTAAIAGCGGAFCITLKNGQYAGRMIGKMSASGGGNYEGEITKPDTGKTYSGKAKLSGNSLQLSGCVFGGLICESQIWTRL
jgi:uncharacterized protein (DUF2147 family)